MFTHVRQFSHLRHTMLLVRAWTQRLTWIWNVDLRAAAKRWMDVSLSLLLLLALSPLMAVVAAIVKLTDGGPILHWQTRVGRHGRLFPFPKFRSMVVDAEQQQARLDPLNAHRAGVTFKLKNDPRVTPVGRFMRKTSIDELPQLWSVLRGDMTLVGPRPPLPREVDGYSLHDRRRLEVDTGLTCIWQVSGRADIDFEHQVEMDVDYINDASLLVDVKLLMQTIKAVITGKGAY